MTQILEQYLDFVNKTEPKETLHRWSFLGCVAAALSRNIHFQLGHIDVYPNMYVLCVGGPGCKKSTAMKIAKNLLAKSGYAEFSFEKSSKQKFLVDLSMGFSAVAKETTAADLLDAPFEYGTHVSEVFVCNDEIVDFFGLGNFDLAALLAKLWDNLDDYSERVKNSDSVKILKPTVNLLGGITPESLQLALPKEAMGQGFMSRIILVYADAQKQRITFPKPPAPEETAKFIEFFRRLRSFGGEMHFEQKAADLIDTIYQNWRNTLDVRLESYSARRFMHLLKLCMILAATDFTLRISVDHVIEANTILFYTEKDMVLAMGEFGKSKYSEAIGKIITALSMADANTMTVAELWKQVHTDLNELKDLHSVINNLRQAKKIEILHSTHEITLLKEIPLDVEGLVDYTRFIREYSYVEKH